jgi:hypothetical protein
MSFCAAAHAQLPAPAATTEDALRQMFDQAAIIFTGQVTAVRHPATAHGLTGTLEVDFSIDDAIRGAAAHTTYTLREWARLAPNSDTSFFIGRRYLILLHTPGPSGLTSPVGGPDGIIPILPANDAASSTTPDAIGLAAQAASAQTSHSSARTSIRIAPTQLDSDAGALASANRLASSMIDLRWVATRVLTPLAYLPSEPAAARPITSFGRLSRGVTSNEFVPASWDDAAVSYQQPSLPIAAANLSAGSATPAQSATQSSTYADVLTLLHSWQAHDHAAR